MHKKLGGETAGTAHPSGPEGYSMPCDIMLSNKTRGKAGQGAAAQGLAEHHLVGGEQLFSFAPLVFLVCYFSLSLLFSFSLEFIVISMVILFLSQPMSFLTFTLPIVFPPPLCRVRE